MTAADHAVPGSFLTVHADFKNSALPCFKTFQGKGGDPCLGNASADSAYAPSVGQNDDPVRSRITAKMHGESHRAFNISEE